MRAHPGLPASLPLVGRIVLALSLWAALGALGHLVNPDRAGAASDPLFRAAQLYEVGAWPLNSTRRGGAPSSVAVGDLNGDGRPDLVVANNFNWDASLGGNGNTVSVLLHTGTSDYPRLFGPKTNFTTGSGPWSVAVADMNKDGKLDVVTADVGSSVSVLLGNGNGTLKEPTTYATADIWPYFLHVADVNNDTWPDVLVGRHTSTTDGFFVRLGTGGGALGAPVAYATLVGARTDAVGDATGDGILDVVTLAGISNDGIMICPGNNTGTFNTTIGPIMTGTFVNSVAIGLLNADATPDLALSTQDNITYDTYVSILIGTGGGAFQPIVQLPGGFIQRTLKVADVDGDGNRDIVAGSQVQWDPVFAFSIFKGNGSGSFAAPVYHAALPMPFRFQIADLDLDGSLDLVSTGFLDPIFELAQTHAVCVLLNDGTGDFRATKRSTAGHMPWGEAIADFNRDGKPDVVISDSLSVSIGLGDGEGGFTHLAGPSLASPDPGIIVAGDFNGDGKADFAVQHGSGTIKGYNGQGDGSFVSGPAFTISGHNLFPKSAADMNRDGKLDLVAATTAAFPEIRILTQGPGPTFTPNAGGVPGSAIHSLAIADWNRDGILDAAVATGNGIWVYMGNGSGGFASSTFCGAGRTYRDVCTGDFNRDGFLDLAGRENALGLGESRGVDVFFGDGIVFQGPQTFATSEQDGYNIETWDANTDGILDLVASGISDPNQQRPYSSVEVQLGVGNGTFGVRTAHHLGVLTTSKRIFSGDVNRDDHPDIVYGTLAQGDPSRAFYIETIASTPPSQGNGLDPKTDYTTRPTTRRVALGDLNRDGKLDVVAGSWSNPGCTMRLGTGLGTLGANTQVFGSIPTHELALADFNRDGWLDLVTTTSGLGSGDMVSFMSGIGGTFGARVDLALASVRKLDVADMNRDGVLDLVVSQDETAEVRVLTGNGNGTFTIQAAAQASNGVFDMEAADVNRDGNPDVIFTTSEPGLLSILYGNGNGTLAAEVIVSGAFPGLLALETADINRDGFMDVVGGTGTPGVCVLWGAAASPFSTFVESETSVAPSDVLVGAAEADGRPFLYCVAGSNQILILEQGTPGSFTEVGDYPTGSLPLSLALGDLNRDGLLDVATANEGSGDVSVLLHGENVVTGVATAPGAAPWARLGQNYPNPFNPTTTIRFALRERSRARLSIYDLQGRLVTTLVDGIVPAGEHTVPWQGRTRHGSTVASGVYFYRLTTESGFEESRRMVVLK